jgi:hypothetical protein
MAVISDCVCKATDHYQLNTTTSLQPETLLQSMCTYTANLQSCTVDAGIAGETMPVVMMIRMTITEAAVALTAGADAAVITMLLITMLTLLLTTTTTTTITTVTAAVAEVRARETGVTRAQKEKKLTGTYLIILFEQLYTGPKFACCYKSMYCTTSVHVTNFMP